MDLIDKQEVRLIESDADAYPQEWNDDYEKGFCDAIHKVLELPTIDAQPIIHAHWIMLDKQVGQCSNCGYCQKSNGIDKTGHGNIHKLVYKWCAVCGAKMEEKHEENSNSV